MRRVCALMVLAFSREGNARGRPGGISPSRACVDERETRKQTTVAAEEQNFGLEGDLESVEKIIGHAEANLLDSTATSLADLMRLLELRRELAEAESGRLTVKWIDTCAKPASEE
jgi:hypothetical protein